MLKQLYKLFSSRHQSLFLDYKVDMRPRWGHGLPAHKDLMDIINSNRLEYGQLIERILSYKDKLWKIQKSGSEKDNTRPVWNNGFLPGLDIATIYTFIAHFRPKRYVEVGSGNSTKVAYLSKMDQKLDTQIISIDPMPRAEIDQLTDQIIRQPFENIKLDLVSLLEPGDILFIDNSHRILPNSDSMVFFLEVLPRLKKGVIVHIHDIYLPYDYPQVMCDRFYSEQYGLAIFVLANPQKYKTIFPNYFVSEDRELAAQLKPFWDHENLNGVEEHGGSFWLMINE